MSTQPIRSPQPLTSEEIRQGIATRVSNVIEGLSVEDRIKLRDSIWESLGRTCSLNRQSYAKFSARYRIDYPKVEPFCSSWSIHFDLDDFGRIVSGFIAGSMGVVIEDLNFVEGKIESVPPDRFRRETDQPIPQPQIIQPKPDNQVGVTRSVGRPRKSRET